MRTITLLATAFFLTSTARAADPPPAEPSPQMLKTFLLAEAQKHFDARRTAVAAIKSPLDVQIRQRKLRDKFIESLGGFPEKTPLNPKVVGKIEAKDYAIEKVIYESRPEHHVTAVVYLPPGKGPFPGVLMPCGHSTNGKASEAYQRACILLAKNGFVVLCYDPIGQGERYQLLEPTAKPVIPSSTSEHTLVGVGAILVGRSTASYRIWDGIRSIDYLASRPEVDPKRLGCTGNSGGGTLTAYLMALDNRIAVAAPSCYITSLEKLFATIGPQDAEQNITGQVAFGMEHSDYVTMRAPKPTLILTGTQDFFDIGGAWTSFREAKLLYGLLGQGENVELFEYNDKHGFSKPRREAAVRWMRRWLQDKNDPITEPNFPIHKDDELQCTRTGQVLEDLKGKSAFMLNAERAEELVAVRQRYLSTAYGEKFRGDVRKLLGLPDKISAAKLPALFDKDRPVLETEKGISVVGVYREPRAREAKKPYVLVLNDAGIEAALAPNGPIETFIKEGYVVYGFDVRGMGATAPKKLTGAGPHYFGADSTEAFLGLHINRPLLGQRVHDVLAIVAWMAERDGEEFPGVNIVGIGKTGPIALHAAALEPRIKGILLAQSIVSWDSVVRTPRSVDQLANAVPGALANYDLPDLVTFIAPRPLMIRVPVDGAGKLVGQEQLEREYAGCKKAYEKKNATKDLQLIGGQ